MKLATSIAILALFDSAEAFRMKQSTVLAQLKANAATNQQAENLAELRDVVNNQTHPVTTGGLEGIGHDGDEGRPFRKPKCIPCHLGKKSDSSHCSSNDSSSSHSSCPHPNWVCKKVRVPHYHRPSNIEGDKTEKDKTEKDEEVEENEENEENDETNGQSDLGMRRKGYKWQWKCYPKTKKCYCPYTGHRIGGGYHGAPSYGGAQ